MKLYPVANSLSFLMWSILAKELENGLPNEVDTDMMGGSKVQLSRSNTLQRKEK